MRRFVSTFARRLLSESTARRTTCTARRIRRGSRRVGGHVPRMSHTFIVLVVAVFIWPAATSAQVLSAQASSRHRTSAEIRTEIHLLHEEDRALPDPDRTLEFVLGSVGMASGAALLIADVVYVFQNAGSLFCEPFDSLPGGTCAPPTYEEGFAIGLGVVGGLLIIGGVIAFIAGGSRRPDEATQTRRREIRRRIRDDQLELRLLPSTVGATVLLNGTF